MPPVAFGNIYYAVKTASRRIANGVLTLLKLCYFVVKTASRRIFSLLAMCPSLIRRLLSTIYVEILFRISILLKLCIDAFKTA